MAGAVQANLISSAYFSREISHCNSGCLSVRKVFFSPEIFIVTYSCNNFNVLFLQKKKNNICMHQSLSSFVPLAFNFKFMIHAKPFQVKLTITIFDRCQRELFINYQFVPSVSLIKPGYKLKWENSHSRSLSALNHLLLNHTGNFHFS